MPNGASRGRPRTARRAVAAEQPLRLTVSGFKSVRDRTSLEIRPLTLVAGTNSSGKSSFIQPLLMMKQTLESAFDPGPLLLYGPNAKFTSYDQPFSRGKAKNDVAETFSVGFSSGDRAREVSFKVSSGQGLRISADSISVGYDQVTVSEKLSQHQRVNLNNLVDRLPRDLVRLLEVQGFDWSVTRNRCFLEVGLIVGGVLDPVKGSIWGLMPGLSSEIASRNLLNLFASDDWTDLIRGVIHVPGLRGNPERSYPRSAVGATYPGTFETYVASIIHSWAEGDPQRLQDLAHDLSDLGLTWKVFARRVDDASVELLVGRMPRPQQGGAFDLVSVADVGFGVSQTLPVVVALRVARPGQIVYIEQPEIHLHPRAQVALGRCLVTAARRGVRVIAETHSSLLLRSIQTHVARGEIPPSDVSMNWFSRDDVSGVTSIVPAVLDEKGRFGEWPVDFDEVVQDADWAYLHAAGD
jgi:predicted ATPase